jgi:hypothetical protein
MGPSGRCSASPPGGRPMAESIFFPPEQPTAAAWLMIIQHGEAGQDAVLLCLPAAWQAPREPAGPEGGFSLHGEPGTDEMPTAAAELGIILVTVQDA